MLHKTDSCLLCAALHCILTIHIAVSMQNRGVIIGIIDNSWHPKMHTIILLSLITATAYCCCHSGFVLVGYKTPWFKIHQDKHFEPVCNPQKTQFPACGPKQSSPYSTTIQLNTITILTVDKVEYLSTLRQEEHLRLSISAL